MAAKKRKRRKNKRLFALDTYALCLSLFLCFLLFFAAIKPEDSASFFPPPVALGFLAIYSLTYDPFLSAYGAKPQEYMIAHSGERETLVLAAAHKRDRC
jgi:hypothetical protein